MISIFVKWIAEISRQIFQDFLKEKSNEFKINLNPDSSQNPEQELYLETERSTGLQLSHRSMATEVEQCNSNKNLFHCAQKTIFRRSSETAGSKRKKYDARIRTNESEKLDRTENPGKFTTLLRKFSPGSKALKTYTEGDPIHNSHRTIRNDTEHEDKKDSGLRISTVVTDATDKKLVKMIILQHKSKNNKPSTASLSSRCHKSATPPRKNAFEFNLKPANPNSTFQRDISALKQSTPVMSFHHPRPSIESQRVPPLPLHMIMNSHQSYSVITELDGIPECGLSSELTLSRKKDLVLGVYRNLLQRNSEIQKSINQYRHDYYQKIRASNPSNLADEMGEPLFTINSAREYSVSQSNEFSKPCELALSICKNKSLTVLKDDSQMPITTEEDETSYQNKQPTRKPPSKSTPKPKKPTIGVPRVQFPLAKTNAIFPNNRPLGFGVFNIPEANPKNAVHSSMKKLVFPTAPIIKETESQKAKKRQFVRHPSAQILERETARPLHSLHSARLYTEQEEPNIRTRQPAYDPKEHNFQKASGEFNNFTAFSLNEFLAARGSLKIPRGGNFQSTSSQWQNYPFGDKILDRMKQTSSRLRYS